MLKPFAHAALALCLAAPAFAADRFEAAVDCAATDTELVFVCTIDLSRGGTPIEDAVFTVTPGMPSMPMAHNIAPVTAEAADAPGSYTVPLTLDMHGRWVLKLEITDPARDLLVIDHNFEPE